MTHRMLHIATGAAVVVLLAFFGATVMGGLSHSSTGCNALPVSMTQLRTEGDGIGTGTIALSDVRVTRHFSGADHRNFARQMPSDALSKTSPGEGRIFASSNGRVIVVVSYVSGDVQLSTSGMGAAGVAHNPVEMVVLDAATGNTISEATFFGPCVTG